MAATSVTDMDLRALKRRPISIYLAPNVTDITLLRPLLALFVQQTLDTLMLEHTDGSVPVYFLLDEFRQLKKMSEITTKLPYVAGYNIKMAFVIQDLKNLDEIYGETSRHSLMGNCGYQLVFGANDQVTAETISKGLGKRTVRYKTESRTIELMGLHRRTKVEQLRERDLMMPQEVRQMPADKMIILAEGQNPIFADKLRFFRTAPFRAMEGFSRANVPDVPATEFLPQRPVPALTSADAPGSPNIKTARFIHPDASYLDQHRKLRRGEATSPKEPTAERFPIAAGVHENSHRRVHAKDLTEDIDLSCSVDLDRGAPSTNGKSLGTRHDSSAAVPSRQLRLFKHEIDARFDIAVHRLRSLVGGSLGEQEERRLSRNWSAIFDETVADDAAALDLETP